MNNLTRISAPTVSPVPLADLKAHLRIWHDEDDAYLILLLNAAIAMIDGPTGIGLAMVTQTWRQLHATRMAGEIVLPLGPVQSVEKVELLTDRTWSETESWTLTNDQRPALLNPLGSWSDHEQIRVTFKAGFSDDASGVPEDLKAAILLIVTHLYEHRGDTDQAMPPAVEAILSRYR